MEEQLFPQATPMHQAPPAGGPGNPGQFGGPSLAAQVTSMATRLKLAEDRYANLSKRNQITEESMLAFEKDIKAELRAITKQAVELRKHIAEMNMKIDAILGELGTVVQKPEFSAVEHYLDLWQPAQFITREEAKRLIADALADARAQASQGARQRDGPDANQDKAMSTGGDNA